MRYLPIALALGVVLLAPTPATAAKRVCLRHSVVKGAKARLVVKDHSLFGCVAGSRRGVRVTPFEYNYPEDGATWSKARLAGTFAAVELEDAYKCVDFRILVVNLRTGGSRTYVAGSNVRTSDTHGCNGYGSRTTDIALRSDGAVAFIAGSEVVRGAGDSDIVTLERGPQIAPASLGLTRSGLVTWRSGAMSRSAVLPRR